MTKSICSTNSDDKIHSLLNTYTLKKQKIETRLEEFKKTPKSNYFYELVFCLLTPQSNAKKCWEAIEQLKKLKKWNRTAISDILKTKTRFHNNKTKYILEIHRNWKKIEGMLNNSNIIELRNLLTANIKGLGPKESSHFLRNIGKSDNKIAILDRHILKNLKELNIIKETTIKSPSHYLKIEKEFIKLSKKLKIPLDELDLLLWSKENGKIFK